MIIYIYIFINNDNYKALALKEDNCQQQENGFFFFCEKNGENLQG